MSNVNVHVGSDFKLYVASPSLVYEVPLARDVRFDASKNEIDGNFRGGGDWERKLPGRIEWTATFDILYDPSSPVWVFLRNSFLSENPTTSIIGFRTLDKNGRGFQGDGFVSSFSQGEPMNDVAVTSIMFTGSGPLFVV